MKTELIILSIIGFVIILIGIAVVSLERRFRKLFLGTNKTNLEEIMNLLAKHVEKLDSEQESNREHLKSVDARLDKTLRKAQVTRFNALTDSGGNQSFALSLLNDEGDGVIISSLYARDRTSVFAKPIVKGKSEYELTEEEASVLQKSK